MSVTEAKILNDETKDGLENLVASMGTEQDKRSHSRFTNNLRLSTDGGQRELSDMYRTNWLAGKVVDIIPNDMTREWREFDGDMDPELVAKLVEEEERIQLSNAFNFAHRWARLYGTAFIVMVIDDGQTPDKPLNLDRIKEGGLKHIKVIDRHRLQRATEVTEDPMDINFGMPEWYMFQRTNVRIHHTRMLRFDGVDIPYEEFREQNYWSDSVLDRLYDPIMDFVTTTQGAASMVFETNVDIVRIQGLMDKIQTSKGEQALRKRFSLASMLKSFNNLMLLDKNEEYDKKTNTFTGLPELIDRFSQVITAATDIPATRFLGSSASGLNATGEGDLKNYYDMLRSTQCQEYKPKLTYFDMIMAKSLGIGDEELTYDFKSLFQMTPAQQAEVEAKQAERDSKYLDQGVIKSSTVAKELKQRKTYSNLTDEDIEELEEIEEFEPEENPDGTDPNADPTEESQDPPASNSPESDPEET